MKTTLFRVKLAFCRKTTLSRHKSSLSKTFPWLVQYGSSRSGYERNMVGTMLKTDKKLLQFDFQSIQKKFLSSLKSDKTSNFESLLNTAQQQILHAERTLLMDLYKDLVRLQGTEEDIGIVQETLAQLNDLFMVCVVGEFNAGKSTFVNALLGNRFVEEGILPTTAQICILRFGPEMKKGRFVDFHGNQLEDAVEYQLPVPWLEKISLVDTPGTNAVIARHEQITERIIPRADLVFFITSSDRPFTESERIFLEKIAQWHKKVILVINKMDLVGRLEDQKKIEQYVHTHAATILGELSSPKVFGLSAKLALESKLSANPRHASLGPAAGLWEKSRFEALETLMTEILSQEERVSSKLLNPLGVAEKIVDRTTAILDSRREILKSDISTLALIDEQMAAFMKDLERDVKYEHLQINSVLDAITKKAEDFLDEKVAMLNYADLWNTESFQKQFEEQVLKSLGVELDEIVKDVSTILASRSKIQARVVLEYVGARPRGELNRMVSQIQDHHFDDVRKNLLGKMSLTVKDVLTWYDKDKELKILSSGVQSGLVQSAFLQAGALTAGGLLFSHAISGIAGTTSLATGGLAAAGGVFLTGAMVLPAKRYQLKQDFRTKIQKLKEKMYESLAHHLDRELRKVYDKIMESISPYSRFVSVESQKVDRSCESFKETRKRIKQIRSYIMT